MEYHPPLHLIVLAIEEGAFGPLSIKITNFTYFYSLIKLMVHENLYRQRNKGIISIRETHYFKK